MESIQNNRLVRKFFSCSKCKEYDSKLVNPFANHIYCSKCGSLLSEIPEMKYKKMKKIVSKTLENKNEEVNKIPYKIKDSLLKKSHHNDKYVDKKIKNQNKEKLHNKNKNSSKNNYNRNQSSSHYSNMNMNFYNDDNNDYQNNNHYNNYNNINRINIDNSNDHRNDFNYYNNEFEQIRPHHNQHRHQHNSRRGHSMNNPPSHIHHHNNNSNDFFSNFFSDSDFQPFSDFDFPSPSPFRITINRQPISNDIFDPMFSSFGSFFNGFFQDNFSSNFRSNIVGDFFSQIMSILERNQAEANKNKHPPASENALKKLKKFSMNEKYCKKDGKGKYELPNCCICLTEIQRGEKTVLLPCGHMFHWKCCLTWLKKNNTCPMCRFEIK